MVQTEKPNVLTKKDFQKFLDSIPESSHLNSKMSAQDWKMLFRIMYGCALRVKESVHLKPENFNFEDRTLSIQITKNSLEKTTILPQDVDDFKEYLKGRVPDATIWQVARQTVAVKAKEFGELAGIEISDKRRERTAKGMFTDIFRNSLARHMAIDGAPPNLIHLKQRTKPPRESPLDRTRPTIEDLRKWESENYQRENDKLKNLLEQKKEIETKNWSFDLEQAIDEILKPHIEDELAIDRSVIKRIILHLKSGKHVILVGPPGVGKTDLARRILKIIGKKVTGNESFEESVASDEWSRYEVVGGLNLNEKFQEGVITRAVLENKWLLIDEFNRANMNKAFGEMFLAIEYRTIKLRPNESKVFSSESITIPESFRMICTMNDFDKNLLLTELSYGLISRFAFVPITPDTTREKEVVEKRIKNILMLQTTDSQFEKCKDQIDTYFKFINNVRIQRNIGVRTSIDVIKYLITATRDTENDDYRWTSLNDALCDYVLPQFDRLDRETIEFVLDKAKMHLTNNYFKSFRDELTISLDRLRKASNWLDNKNESR